MAVNLLPPADVLAVPGVTLATAAAAIRASDRDDLALLVCAPDTTMAAVFTQSSFRAAPVILAEQRIQAGGVRALLINSGNANAATGAEGHEDARALCDRLAAALDIAPEAVAPFSTGVIGERLPVARMLDPIQALPAGLAEDGWLRAGNAIMTTDTVAKVCSTQVAIEDQTITVTGMAKGSGMIRPDMATMLAYVCCDAPVTDACLQRLLTRVVAGTFNRITVDGDTSTNDALVLAATGVAAVEPISDPQSPAAEALAAGLEAVALELAQAIVRDGEGATKFVTVEVSGGHDEAECLEVAFTVAESPLVKTALFASDPNWGRLAMAVGRARVDGLDVAGVAAWFDQVPVMAGGVMAPGYTEDAGAAVLEQDEFRIRVDLGRGSARAEVWTSDLSYEYVRINAEYRT